MNLAYKYPIIFWNCACLIVDSGGAETEEIEEDLYIEETIDSDVEDFTIEEEKDEEEEAEEKEVSKSKKAKTTNFGKIATAIGKMKSAGITISPPDINHSSYTFSPDAEKNLIRFGLSGITRVGEELIQTIIKNRPYNSIVDFTKRIKVNKPQMFNLIKAGAFDSFGTREEVMRDYVELIYDKKSRVTLQNMRMLLEYNLLPEELDFQKRVYNFNKYLKKFKDGDFYFIDDIALAFLDKNYDIDNLVPTEDGMKIKQATWDKIYKKEMEPIRVYIKQNTEALLNAINQRQFKEIWDKYCAGSISSWEMSSASCYFHEHELDNVNYGYYKIDDYFQLFSEPDIERIINIKGRTIPLYKIHRIAGTVLDRDKNKKTVTLLTTKGVVTVKIYGNAFSHYDKQISERDVSGVKHVIEKSWFSRGNKIIVTGVRTGDTFLCKKYKSTPFHLVELITSIDEDKTIKTQIMRQGEEE